MSNPLVSVIIPAYNHENYAQDTIKSIIAQTYQNIELIIIDDGSKDSTWTKINELKTECEKRFSRICFKTKANGGTCETLNMLLDLAKGKFIYLIASDDLAKPQAIEKEIAFLENNPQYVLAVGDNELINAQSNPIGWNEKQTSCSLASAKYKTFGEFLKENNQDVNFYSDEFGQYKTFVTKNYVPNGYLVKTNAIKSIGGFTKEAPLEDWYLMLQLSKIGKFKYLDEVLFSYRWHDTNTVKNKKRMNEISFKTMMYEQKLVSRQGNEHWQDIYLRQISQIKTKFKIGNIIEYYTQRNLQWKKYILSIFGRKFVVRKKKIKQP
ncbi:MAG: glycosyltransferase family 2 protein [Alphaproteobacteria bacterium]|nr:glycosyltransferase family 2 protein [Alphaproteobacteria bacterium]